jgi:IS30 family transposase
MVAPDERKLIAETIRDLEYGIGELKEKRDTMDREISRKRERLQAWQTKLAELAGNAPLAESHKRAPRGANLKTVLTLLLASTTPRQGLSCAELVEKTKLPFSSVHAALKQGEQQGVVQQVETGFWRPERPELPSPMETNGKVN